VRRAFVAAAILEVILWARHVAQDLSWRSKGRGYRAGDHSFSAAARARSTIGRQEERSAMNEEPTHKRSMPPLETSTRLAYERTYLAHERTLMGWVRTAIALISFGFTIAKVFEYLHEKEGARAPLLGPRAVGIIMIATGLVALVPATERGEAQFSD